MLNNVFKLAHHMPIRTNELSTRWTLKRLGGGGLKGPPPRALDISHDYSATRKLSPRHFMTFFFQVSRTFWHQICDARGYGSEVM